MSETPAKPDQQQPTGQEGAPKEGNPRGAKGPTGSWWSRFNRSRGVAKFRRNRVAMFALAVIGLYAGLAVWISTLEVVDWVGRKTDRWDLRRSAILSALLPYRTAERVGPPNLAGFGLRQDAKNRANQYGILLKLVEQCLDAAESIGPDSERTARDVFDEQAMAERRIANLPVEEVRRLANEARTKFEEYDQFNRRTISSDNVRIAAEKVLRSLTALASLDAESDEAKSRVDDLSFEVEEVGFAIEDEQADGGEESFFKDVEASKFMDWAEAIRAGGPLPEELGETLASIPEMIREGVSEMEGPMQAKLDEIQPLILQMLPIPDGFAGFMYRMRISLGTDQQGRSILIRAVYSAKIALQVGAIAALVSVAIGTLIGAAAAYFGGWVDHAVIWVYSTLSSIPYLVLLTLLAFVFQTSDWVLPWDKSVKVANTLIPLYAAFCLTFWIGACRVIRGEVMKLKQLEYVQAATALGLGRGRILVRHIVPNTLHLVFISFSLLVIGAIKSEVVLTFLGLGLKEGASWGLMISHSKHEVVNGFFWQIGAATFFMFVLVLMFNIVSDALQDAFDPKHVG